MPREASRAPCPLAELVQFHCQLQEQRILCQPVERVFRLCPHRPAVEVTHLVEYDARNEPFLPETLAYADGRVAPAGEYTHGWHGARDAKDV